MPRPKKNANGKLKTSLSDIDRLTAQCALKEKERAEAEVRAGEANVVAAQMALKGVQGDLVKATDEYIVSQTALQKTYATNAGDSYNLKTGAITRQVIEVEDKS